MNNFTFHNPVKVHFGKGKVEKISKEVKDYKKILLVYGTSSIKDFGIYNQVIELLEGKEVYELSGIRPNAKVDKVYEGIELCKENDIDFVLAVGGGSVIDSAKAIALAAKTNHDFWDYFFLKGNKPSELIDLGTVLTVSCNGSELDATCVITNPKTKQKRYYNDPTLFPKFSVIDPTYSFTVPKTQIISQSIDVISHILEEYFSKPTYTTTTDYLSEALLKSVIKNVEISLADSKNYQARANLSWAGSLAVSGLISLGKEGDWTSHKIEDALSAHFDIPHGLGLSAIHPNYLKYIYKDHIEKFKHFALEVFQVNPVAKSDEEIALEGIERLQDFFEELGAPIRLRDLKVDEESLEKISKDIELNQASYSKLESYDIFQILKSSY
ncbi:MAG: iron-containing alcohol dehydrogenase [Finegoldia sp.]|nr:iron-containing alcohol dehydrogenase [Finegoldia sp.]